MIAHGCVITKMKENGVKMTQVSYLAPGAASPWKIGFRSAKVKNMADLNDRACAWADAVDFCHEMKNYDIDGYALVEAPMTVELPTPPRSHGALGAQRVFTYINTIWDTDGVDFRVKAMLLTKEHVIEGLAFVRRSQEHRPVEYSTERNCWGYKKLAVADERGGYRPAPGVTMQQLLNIAQRGAPYV